MVNHGSSHLGALRYRIVDRYFTLLRALDMHDRIYI
jgi:hypothetical protein